MIGKQISHYKILEKLGGGGMGVVYKAQDTKLDRFVALKFLPPHLSQAEDEKKRFIHEAKAASALDHPNICTIYEIDETEDGQLFIAMACYEGESLKNRIERGALRVEQVLDIAIQIAEGLVKAHEQEIVHRDLKPANVMITKDGAVKIVDFGLAKLRGLTRLTKSGSTLGTVSYMSPEQGRGEDVDHRTDIFSFGVLLYEMLAGCQPFQGDYEQAVIYSILNEEPEPLGDDVPEELQNVVLRALEKDPEKRHQSVDQLLTQLKELRGDVAEARAVDLKLLLRLLKRPKYAVATFSILLILALAVVLPFQQRSKLQRARELLPRIESLALTGKYFEAYDLALQAEKHLKDDSTIARLLPIISDRLTITSEPEGASVFSKRFAANEQGTPPEKEYIGVTPITHFRTARGAHKVSIEKQGYVPVERIASSELSRVDGPFFGISPDIKIDVKLFKTDEIPKDMAFVPGGKYRLVSHDAPTIAQVDLDDYFIDKYEVSNKRYKTFIDAGGYLTKEYWKYSFLRNGKELSWQEAMPLFRDRTGLPGPRSWRNQEYPGGKGSHPVTNITWYEAAAYAEFAGKRLPTVFQWEKAARDGRFTYVGYIVMPWGHVSAKEMSANRANFGGNDTVPVDSYEFGISPFGCYNMAGNVTEWCLNEMGGRYATTGGSWNDPEYMFHFYGPFPGFYFASSLGFRCVRNSPEAISDQGAMHIDLAEQTPSYSPVDEATFRSFLSHYKYDKKPLEAQIIETVETASWTREKIRFSGIGSDQIIAYLYLPKRATKPYQCINYIPGASIFYTQKVSEEAERALASHVKSGRAVLAVAPWGALEREWPADYTRPKPNTVGFRELMVRHAIEFSIGLDYLSTRDDVDMAKLAYFGISRGAQRWLVHAAVETRYRSVILIGAGVFEYDQHKLPEVNPTNLVSYIKAPKLLLHGKYDEDSHLERNLRPLYNLLSEPKKLVLFETGHIPPLEVRVPVINQWLDETLGPIRFE